MDVRNIQVQAWSNTPGMMADDDDSSIDRCRRGQNQNQRNSIRVFIVHSVRLEKSRTKWTIHILRGRRKTRGLMKGWVYVAATSILNDARLVVPGKVQPACLDYRRAGRYPNHIRFFSTYEIGLILIWQYLDSFAFFPSCTFMLHFRSVSP